MQEAKNLKELYTKEKPMKIEANTNNLVAVYLLNGLIYIGELSTLTSDNAGISITRPLAFAPGAQKGQMMLMEAFPFSDFNGTFNIEKSSYISITPVDDRKAISEYNSAVKKIREAKSGLILP